MVCCRSCTRNRKGPCFLLFSLLLLLLLLPLCSARGTFLVSELLPRAPQVRRPSSASTAQFSLSPRRRPLFLRSGEKEDEEKIMARATIGSRPPSCERRCATCGHCEAVQVPAVPLQRRKDLSSRGDDTSNYKPVSWKCECGGMITDP